MAYETFDMYNPHEDRKEEIGAEFGIFPVKLEKRMLTFMGKYSVGVDLTTFGGDLATGSIQDLLITNTVKSLSINGKPHKWNKDRSLWESLPDHYDEEKYDSIAERLVRLSVKHNKRMARNPKFAMVFADYLEEDEEENPTSSSTSKPSTRSLEAVEGSQKTSNVS